MLYYRAISIFLGILFIQGCGFQPLYSKNNQINLPEFSKIIISPIPDRSGQILRNHLLFALNPKGEPIRPIYSLNIKLIESTASLAVRKDAIATRANLMVGTEFSLNNIKDEKSLYAGKYNITVSYNILDTEYATIAVKKNALSRGLLEISHGIRNQLGVYFSRVQE